MDNYIYLGGAVGDSSPDSPGATTYSNRGYFNPVLIKLDKSFRYVWGYRMDYTNDASTKYPEAYAEQSSGDKVSRSVDILFADHQNDKIYGLIVKRANTGELR